MCFIKNQFWDESETVVQYHPAIDLYVDNFLVLHLWRPLEVDLVVPPGMLVGFKRPRIISFEGTPIGVTDDSMLQMLDYSRVLRDEVIRVLQENDAMLAFAEDEELTRVLANDIVVRLFAPPNRQAIRVCLQASEMVPLPQRTE